MATWPTPRPSTPQAYSDRTNEQPGPRLGTAGRAPASSREAAGIGLVTALRRALPTVALLAIGLGATPAHAGDLTAGMRVANAVYPAVSQRCGTVTVEHGVLNPPNDTNGAIAEAYESDCGVRIKPGIAAAYSDSMLCSLLTHEWGHLASRRFPENASDPYHSLNPADNMYGPALVHHPACGESDDARTTRQAREDAATIAAEKAETGRADRRGEIKDELSELKQQLRAARAARRRADGARRARYARRIRGLRVRIRRLRAEYRSLQTVPIPAMAALGRPHTGRASFGPTDLLAGHVEASAHSHPAP